MRYVVSRIVEVSMNKIALGIRFGVYDWTAERVIIASSVFSLSVLHVKPV